MDNAAAAFRNTILSIYGIRTPACLYGTFDKTYRQAAAERNKQKRHRPGRCLFCYPSFPVLYQILYDEDRRTQHGQHHTGHAVENLGGRLVGKFGGDLCPQQGGQDTEQQTP